MTFFVKRLVKFLSKQLFGLPILGYRVVIHDPPLFFEKGGDNEGMGTVRLVGE